MKTIEEPITKPLTREEEIYILENIKRLQSYYPYRHCYGWKEEGKILFNATTTKRHMNACLRKGFPVWKLV